MKNFRYVGYFLSGTIWLLIGGIPILPFGIFALAGAWKDSRKLFAAGMVFLGLILSFFGTGLYLDIAPEGKITSYSVSPSLGFNLNFISSYLYKPKFLLSGATTGGRIVVDESFDCLAKNEMQCFSNLFDETFVGASKQDLTNEVNQLLGQTGKLKSKRLADIRYTKIAEKKAEVFQYFYVVKTEKTPDFVLILGARKKDREWKVVSLNVAPA